MRLIVGLFILLCSPIHAASLALENFDQLKLATFMSALSPEVQEREVSQIETPTTGISIESFFPKREEESAFRIHCRSTFFSGSPYPSTGKCQIIIDLNHQQLERSYDELGVKSQDAQVIWAFRSAMTEGKERKEFRSYGKRKGTNALGKWSNIFDYYFTCSQAHCAFMFSQKALRP